MLGMAGRMLPFRCYLSRNTSPAIRLLTQKSKSSSLRAGYQGLAQANVSHKAAPNFRCFASRKADKFEASLQETAALDQLIDLMLDCKSQEELGKLVTDNLLSYDQKFWIRVASRNDTASSPEEQQRLQSLATTTMRMVDSLVKRTDTTISESGRLLESILKAAADERGEWELPLAPDKLDAMEKKIHENFGSLDESLLATSGAWMRKAANDKMDGMVTLLQQVLQIYAAKALTIQSSPQQAQEDEVLDEVLRAPEGSWVNKIQQETKAGRISESSFISAIRKRMETIVLALPSGSNAQRIQAEYLKELEGRAEGVFKSQQANST